MRPGCPPRVANGRAVETFGLEQPGRRRQMLLSFANPAASSERVQKELVDALVERRKLEPLLQICERFIAGYRLDEMLQQGGVAAAKSAPLRREPAVEARVAVDLQAVEKVAVEQRGQRSQPLGSKRLDALLDRLG